MLWVQSLRSFWGVFSHLIRNALDHGIEDPDERIRKDKPREGHIILRSWMDRRHLFISIIDDGRGIDWIQIKRRAEQQGHSITSDQDLEDALFIDGVSTQTDVTEVSGRGVGMAAIKSVCEELQASIQVLSEDGKGSEFRFSFLLDEQNYMDGVA